ncbi:hypothetical protein H2200_004665 [Cladophialophora chaetospira]|uniref:Peptidase A1 domain-containing protein n=1 Tax=Cladophialophora chaetospira TaxID=386627 RepID=A0AA38XDI7_9EURO|nr:hypothetical protein H2200_004665 [Cladophialophora chaetospira]
MVSMAACQPIVALELAVIGFLAFSPGALCFDIFSNSGLGVQQVLPGLSVEPSPSALGNVVQIPLQRRFIQYNGRFYFAQVNVGSPEQSLELIVDTGSTSTWVYGTDYCQDQSNNSNYQCYDPNKSNTSTIIPAPPAFEARYPHNKFKGLYVEDEIAVGTAKLGKDTRFGMVQTGDGIARGGLIGMGFDTAEFGPNNSFGYQYPDILDLFYNESVIDSRAFGLFLNNGSVPENEARGSLVFGGYDKSKFTGPLVSFAITSPSDVRRVGAPLASISATIAHIPVPIWTAAGDVDVNGTSIPAVFDSGDMMTAVPVPALAELIKQINGYRNGMLNKMQPGGKFDASMKCGHSTADILVHFTFASFADTTITINVPFSELVLPAPWGEDCLFALQPKLKNPSKPYWFNFGSSVVDSMYLVVDYDTNTIQIAKANYDGRETDIVPIRHR